MPLDPLDSPATTEQLYALAQAQRLTFPALEYALRMIGTVPNAQTWRRFIDNQLLLIGAAFVLAGLIFFFAYNWADMHRFGKFAILEIAVLGIAVFVLLRGLEHISGQVALMAVSVLLGILLAVYGQIYQTGADAFGLFLAWAILIIPWVLLGSFAPLWLLLLLLFNLSLILYWAQVITPSRDLPTDLMLLLFLLNGVAMLAWEYAHKRGINWIQKQWLGVLIFSAVLTVLIIPTLVLIIDLDYFLVSDRLSGLAAILYVGVTTLSLWYYRYKRHDLLLLATCLLGAIIALTTAIAKILPLPEIISWLFLALLITGEATMATKWLLHTATIWQEETKI